MERSEGRLRSQKSRKRPLSIEKDTWIEIKKKKGGDLEIQRTREVKVTVL